MTGAISAGAVPLGTVPILGSTDPKREARRVERNRMATAIGRAVQRQIAQPFRLARLHGIADGERRVAQARRLQASAEANTAMGFVYGQFLHHVARSVAQGARGAHAAASRTVTVRA